MKNLSFSEITDEGKLKLNNSEEYESIMVQLSEEKTPIAFHHKLIELMKNGLSENDARKMILHDKIEMEMYYREGYGLFMVESDAVAGGADIYCPYTKDQYVYEGQY